ncbi:hypothetical protein JCM8208_000101 [Rhodotorula glutinis]
MGRRKISIAPIKDDRNRQVTFLKRKNGLFKKAYELGVLCSADVAVVVFNANGKLFEFHSGDMDQILLRYSHYAGPAHEKRGPDDYMNKDLDSATKSGTGGKMTSLSDEDGSDDDDDDKPRVAAGSSGVRAIPQTSKGKQAIRAQAERKAKGVEAARSQSVDEARTPSDSRASSFSGPSAQYLPQPPELHHQQQHHHDAGGGGAQLPQDPSQHNGFAPSSALPFPFGGLPNLAPGPNGLPNLFPFSPGAGMPSFRAFPAGLAPNFPFSMPTPFGFPPQQQQAQHSPQHQQMNGASAPPASNGVPAWFGALNPGAGQGQPPTPHLQLMQQLGMPGGMPGWPGASMADPAAAMQAFQQQQRHLQQQQHEASQRHHQQAPPPQFSSPFAPPYHLQQQHPQQQEPDASPSSHPRPAPMYGTPAVMPPPPQPQHHHSTPSLPTYPPATPGSSAGGGPDAPTSRPDSVTSMHSHAPSHHSPAPQGSSASHASPHLDAWQNKPRLSVAIPAESGAKEGTKPGLVTAGGASILGAGFGYGGRAGTGEVAHEHDEERREGGGGGDGEQDDASVPKSAFAADLLPSPFYPNQNPAASSSSYGFMSGYGGQASTSSQHFQWPTAPPPSQGGSGPAPPLGVDEAPDLVRRGSFSDLTSAAAAAQAGEGEDGEREEAREGEGRGTKRGNEEDEEGAEEPSVARGRKRRG